MSKSAELTPDMRGKRRLLSFGTHMVGLTGLALIGVGCLPDEQRSSRRLPPNEPPQVNLTSSWGVGLLGAALMAGPVMRFLNRSSTR